MSKIDENQIRRHLKTLSQIEPTSEATDRAMEKVRDSLSDKKKMRESTSLRQFPKRPIAKLAAAAVLLIAVGYAVGRLTTPQPDMEQLQSALETSLRASLTKDMDHRWKSAFAANCIQLKDELQQQVRRDLTEFAAQTLAASNSRTEQRLIQLINLIETARARDRRQTAAALEKIEYDKKLLGKGLVALAAQTSELRDIKQD
jgi:flagellar biosynthesis regulator FlaF